MYYMQPQFSEFEVASCVQGLKKAFLKAATSKLQK